MMRCSLCYHEPIESYNKRTKSRKGLISYYKTNGITSLEKYANASHVILYKTFEEKINSSWKGSVEKQLAKTHPKISRSSIFDFFAVKNLYKQGNVETIIVFGRS
jgi:hypothetical protein